MNPPSTIRLALVQPRTDPRDPPKNVARALVYLEQAVALGAQVVCFPETYPGPWTLPLSYDPLPELAARARDLDVYVVAGCLEPVPDEPDRYYNCLVLLGPDGREMGRYRRTTPRGPWIYRGGRFWDFGYREASELPVFETRYCPIGLLVCSEVYVPELARELALQGAEVILMPAGLAKRAQWETWRVLMRARAVENLAYTATCQNLIGEEGEGPGLAMICSPEGVLAESTSEGLLVADCDLGRIRFLRAQEDGPRFPGGKACKAGVLWQWYRPELYSRQAAARPGLG